MSQVDRALLDQPVGRLVRASLEILRLAVRRERLPDAPEGTQETPRRQRVEAVARLFAREELPVDPEAPRSARREGLSLRALLGPEALPEDPVPPPRPRRPGLLRTTFRAETLPLDPPEERPRGGRWLAWLFAPERLDPHQEP